MFKNEWTALGLGNGERSSEEKAHFSESNLELKKWFTPIFPIPLLLNWQLFSSYRSSSSTSSGCWAGTKGIFMQLITATWSIDVNHLLVDILLTSEVSSNHFLASPGKIQNEAFCHRSWKGPDCQCKVENTMFKGLTDSLLNASARFLHQRTSIYWGPLQCEGLHLDCAWKLNV